VTSPRRLLAIGLLSWAAASACQGSKTTSLVCQPFASAQELCDGVGCDPTWTAVQTDHAYCQSCNAIGTCLAGDCGDYHVVTCNALDSGHSYYYRRDTGALVAAVFAGAPNPVSTCSVVSTETFSPPPSCDSRTYSALPGWCSPDAGAAGERVFPCCSNTLANCSATVDCPATWSEAQAQAPSLCDPNGRRTHPELGSCGGDHVFRYRWGTPPLTLFYDASGALIAVVDEILGRCEYGPLVGLTLPACDLTLTSACPDGGAAP